MKRCGYFLLALLILTTIKSYSQNEDDTLHSRKHNRKTKLQLKIDSNGMATFLPDTVIHEADDSVVSEETDDEADSESESTEATETDSKPVYSYPQEDTAESSPSSISSSNWKDITKDLNYPDIKEKEINKPHTSSPWIKYVIYGIGIIITIFLIYQIILLALKPPNKKVDEKIDVTEIDPEQLPVENLETMLKSSIESGDFRNAVRFSYLITLKNLSDKKLIVRTKDKTNFDYINELSSHPMLNVFREITRAFEFTWYGEVIPAPDDYKRFESKYVSLNEAITKGANR